MRSTRKSKECKVRGTVTRASGEAARIIAYLPPDLAKALKLRAVERGLSGSDCVREAVAAWLR